ncbi:hypothetical protein JCM5350_001277 [Sporobolomyces pararoseus]
MSSPKVSTLPLVALHRLLTSFSFPQPNLDYLSPLPATILKCIFDIAQSSETPLVTPLARRYLQFQQEPLFHRVSLKSYEQLDELCKTAETKPNLMRCIAHLHVDIKLEQAAGLDWKSPSETKDPLVPSDEQLRKTLFPLLSNTLDISISGSSRLASLILRPEVAAFSLPKLVHLHLCSTFADLDDPFHPSYYSRLSYYTNLHHLSLSVRRNPLSIRLSSKPAPPVLQLDHCIVSLELSGPLTVSQPSVERILRQIGYFDSLKLRDECQNSVIFEFLDVVAEIDCSWDFSALDLSALGLGSTRSKQARVASFSEFRSLSHLSVGGACSTASSCNSTLQDSAIGVLAFREEAEVDLDKLTELIKGSEKIETLETIILDTVKGKIGNRIEEERAPYRDGIDGEYQTYPDWEFPRWREGFSRRGSEKLWRVAERNGVQLRGSAMDALEVEDEYEEELEILRAYESGIESDESSIN